MVNLWAHVTMHDPDDEPGLNKALRKSGNLVLSATLEYSERCLAQDIWVIIDLGRIPSMTVRWLTTASTTTSASRSRV
jgi:hypothetical protein